MLKYLRAPKVAPHADDMPQGVGNLIEMLDAGLVIGE